ncbi:MAG: hypothetical protein QOJ46_690 [bacterium]
MILASGAANAVGMAVGGVLAVLVISAVFYLVGRGEDRDRAVAPADASPAASGDAAPAPDPPAGDRSAPEPGPAGPRRPRAPASARRRRRP